jgi:lipopolysaccharide transport system ATP-binding protein
MSSSAAVLRADDVGKRYDIFDRPSDRLRQFVLPRLRRFFGAPPRSYLREFWALRNVSFTLAQGESLGIIGRNGSGKSTLLQLITGVLAPTEGSIEVRGRVAALLELGSGFNPEFTGRENVFLNGELLGLTPRQIEQRFDQIAAFADIGTFLDQPVKTYSSGMFVRLAFAVVAHVDADVLVVDEALSVGDVFFAQKCMRLFREFRERGGSLLFVSHDASAVVNLCNRALWLEGGRARGEGDPETLCRRYVRQLYAERIGGRSEQESVAAEPSAAVPAAAAVGPLPADVVLLREFWAPEQRANPISISDFHQASEAFGIGGACIVDAGFFDQQDMRLTVVHGGQAVRLSLFVRCLRRIEFPAFGVVLKDRLGQAVFTEGSTLAFEGFYQEQGLAFEPDQYVRADFSFFMPVLIEGDYSLTVAIAEGFGHDHVQHHLIHDALALRSLGSRLLHGIAGLHGIDLRIAIYDKSGDGH